MIVVALLTVREGQLAPYQAYERAAAEILARHGAAIERVVVLEGAPYREMHVVRFPTPEAWSAYRADAALAALAAERAAVIASTEVWIGEDGAPYR